MKNKQTLCKYYPDLLNELDKHTDPDVIRRVHDLDAVYTAYEPPIHLTFSKMQALHTGTAKQIPWISWLQTLTWRLWRTSLGIAAVLTFKLFVGMAIATIEPALSVVLRVNPRLKQVAQNGLYQDIRLSKTSNGFTITLEKAYADANRVILAYTISKPESYKYDVAMLSPTLTTQQGTSLSRIDGSGIVNEKGQEGTDAFLFSFDASGVVGSQKTLNLHASIWRLRIRDLNLQNIQSSFSFDFSLPVHPSRIAEVH